MNFAFSIDFRNYKRVGGLCPKAANLSCQTDYENQKAVHGTKAYGWARSFWHRRNLRAQREIALCSAKFMETKAALPLLLDLNNST